jgi:hypothetical protein
MRRPASSTAARHVSDAHASASAREGPSTTANPPMAPPRPGGPHARPRPRRPGPAQGCGPSRRYATQAATLITLIPLLDRRRPQDRADARFLGAPRSASPGWLESNPRRRLTMSEHRELLLPDAEDMCCRGALTVGLPASRQQRIYRWPRSPLFPPSPNPHGGGWWCLAVEVTRVPLADHQAGDGLGRRQRVAAEGL